MSTDGKHLISADELSSLYQKERTRYVRLAVGYIQDEKEAEDIFHNCILYILSNKDRIYVTDVRAYFASMIKYNCYRYLERHRRILEADSEEAGKFWADHIERLSDAGSNDISGKMDIPELLKQCHDMLPELTFNVFEAKRIERMSYKEISKVFGISESRINFEMTRAMKVFRKVFKDYDIFTLAVLMTALSSMESLVQKLS